MKLYSCKV